MTPARVDDSEEIRRLQGCLNDLISVMALPALWSGQGPMQIVEALLDGMVRMLRLEFAYARLTWVFDGSLREAIRAAPPVDAADIVEIVGERLMALAHKPSFARRERITNPVGEGEVHVARFALGLFDAVGVLIVGSERADFPTQAEELVLRVAANQAAIGLQEALRLAEQQRTARDLEKRVVERTARLSALNVELRTEIEERQRTEADLVKLASLVQHSDDFIGFAGLDGYLLFLNAAGRNLVGLRDDSDITSLHVSDFAHSQDRPRVASEIWPAVVANRRWDGEICFRHFATGAPIPMHKHVFLIGEPHGGRPMVVATISRDITQRKRAEAEAIVLKDELGAELAEMRRLHQLSLRLEVGSDLLPHLEEVLDATIALQHADCGNVRLYDAETGTHDLVAQRGFGPEYGERFKSVAHKDVKCGDALARGARVVIEDMQATPLFTGGGEMVGTMSTHFRAPHRPSDRELRFTDIYARQAANVIERGRAAQALRRSEAYLAEGQKLSHTASWSVNARSGEIWWSAEHYRIFGLEPGSDHVDFAVVAMIHEDDRACASSHFQRAMRERTEYDGEFRIVRPDGSVRHCRSVGRPVFDAAGEMVEFVGTLADVTERKAAEQALAKAREDIAHVSRVTTMGELASSIAHEVNQPLAAIVTNANACAHWLAAQPANMGEARSAAQRIIRDANRASDVISHIRAFLTRGKPLKSPLRLEEVIADVANLVQEEARDKGVVLELRSAADLPGLLGDRVQLQQVLLNLIINAMEAMSGMRDRPHAIAIGAELHGDHEVRLSVRDSGPGLDPRQIERAFDMFYTTKPHGMGMGLAISRSIIESHGGRLWAAPNDGTGQTFQFTLPVDELERR
jgi:PAS domain S-box-containing protein